MTIRTAIYLDRDGKQKCVYHERTAPPDPRREDGGQVTHAWEHPMDERDTCEACTRGVLPKEVRR